MGLLSRQQRLGAAAALLAASAFLSRLMGLVRDKIISWQFGAGSEADMYFAAFVVPDIINYLLAGGFMSITIIPLLARGFREDENEAWNFFSCVFIWITAAAIILTGLGEVFAQILARAIAPGFDAGQCARLAFFMRIILPGQIFFLSGACFTALLLLRRQFAMPALTPLVYNGCIIIFGLCLPLLPGMTSQAGFGMTGYCVGVSIGAAIGAFFLPWLIARQVKLELRWILWHPWLKKFAIIALPLMLGQTIVMLDEQFLRVFGSLLGEGWVSLLNYGRRIAQVPVALMGQALAAASYPFLVNLLAKNDKAAFDQTLRNALAAGLTLIIPCAMLMISAALPILGVIFQGGRFGEAETIACAPLTRLLLIPAPFWIIYMVLARAFYATGDTLTPAVTGTIITLISIPCYYFIAVPLGAWAITIVSGLGIAAYTLWLLALWIRRQGAEAFTGLRALSLKCFLLAIPASCAAWGSLRFLADRLALDSFVKLFCALCVATACFCLVFALCGRFFCPAIFNGIWRNLVKRFK